VHDQDHRYARIRYAATGALATLGVVGAIAGAAALAAEPSAKAPAHAALANAAATKRPTSPARDKTQTPPSPVNQQPFVDAIQQLVNDGTISSTQGQAVDSQIQTGRIDTQTLASSGFTQAQLQAVQQALRNTKRALAAPAVAGAPASTKEPPPSGICAPSGKEPPAAAQGNSSTPK
jgi:hypothetical protein